MAESHTIEPSNKPLPFPYLNTGSIAKSVQTRKGFDNVRTKPCAAFLVA